MVTVEGHSIPFPAEAGDYPGSRAESVEGGSSEFRVWNLDFMTVKTLGSLWWILIPPKIPECSSIPNCRDGRGT